MAPQELYAACRRRVNWQAEWVKHLTPVHLAVSGEARDDDPLARVLRIQTANLCILFTADWTKRGPSGTACVASYAGARQEVQVALAEPESYSGEISRSSAEALMELVEWSYGSDIGGDRLSLVQNAVARSLQGNEDPEVNYRLLLSRAPSILGEVRMQWKFFLEGKVEEFMDQIQALEDEVAATVQGFSDRTSAMIKGLSDTVLAAVGVLIGSFIAALVKGETGPSVLWIGIGAYLVYLLAFPLAYNMTQQWQAHRVLNEQFTLRQKRFEERLYPDKVGEIVNDRVRKSKRRFRIWYGLTLLAYLAVAGAIVLVVLFVAPLLDGPGPEKVTTLFQGFSSPGIGCQMG